MAYTDAPKFDSSFNEAIYRQGVVPFQSRYGRILVEAQPSSPEEYEQVLRELAQAGRSPIVAVGFSYAAAVEAVANDFPNLQFTIIDSVVEAPNVQSIVFKEHEGSFLVGALAALTVDADQFGFVGGADFPIIRRFGCGFAQGVKYVNEDAQVLISMVAPDVSGFANPSRAADLARNLMSDGAQVIYAAAGGSGNGVYQAAAEREGYYAIGVDSNQNYLHVGTMLTSMVKNVGIAAYGAWEEAEQGQWRPGVKVLGIAENGVDWVLDIFNRNLVTLEVEEEINKLRNDIISGDIQVADYVNNNQCPVAMIER